ncbi:MAG: hypothetical protein ACTSWP_03580 [Candidatus Freyarchaeota archaeon]
MFSVFVFGVLPESSGKTTVCTAIVRGLSLRGWNVGVFKPRSGHSYWYHHDIYAKCSAEGRLYSWDILRLSQAKGGRPLLLEVLNPVDALFSPLDRLSLDESSVEVRLSNPFFELVVERYTILDGRVKSVLCVNGVNFESDSLLFKNWAYVKRLMDNADKVIIAESLEEWNDVYSNYAPTAIRSCYKKVCSEHEVVVVEGFNDAVCPDPALRFNLVLGVAPGAVFCYRGDRFRKAVEVVAGAVRDPRSLEARNVLEFLKPERAVRLPALTSRETSDYELLARKLGEVVEVVESEAAKWRENEEGGRRPATEGG